jgi:hypothetical protein
MEILWRSLWHFRHLKIKLKRGRNTQVRRSLTSSDSLKVM